MAAVLKNGNLSITGDAADNQVLITEPSTGTFRVAGVDDTTVNGQASVEFANVTGNLKIFGGPLIPLSVTLQAGASTFKENGESGWHFPVGVGLALTIPNPVFSIKPWLAPRIDIVRESNNTVLQDRSAGGYDTDTNFGISGGVDFGFLSGLAVRVMYDRVSRASNGNSSTPAVFSLGLGFKVGT